ncbi:MAG: hypothetical protein QOE28_2224 [Solirubrobacteraceae bacterium]|nr:hypothetical protein [Solirubrobacteraceae bacterium]
MAQRSRKRRRPAAAPPPAAAAAPEVPAPAGRDDALRRGYARGRERDDAIRARLQPLAPGERPRAVTVSAGFAALLAVGNLIATALSHPTAAEWRFGALQFLILAAAAIGMWRVRYWAVLGFEALLALAVLWAFLSLLRASNLAAVVFCIVVVGACGTLFWFLIRSLARIQMPRYPTGDSRSEPSR